MRLITGLAIMVKLIAACLPAFLGLIKTVHHTIKMSRVDGKDFIIIM